MKFVIGIAFVVILGALAAAGLFMLRRPPPSEQDPTQAHRRMARALAWRVGLSITLFLVILLSYQMGWIRPTGLPLR